MYKKTQATVWSAVIRSKLIFALHTVALTQAQEHKFNAFQARGVRKILGWEATYVNRANTNAKLLAEANRITSKGPTHKDAFIKMSDRLAAERQKYFGHLLREPLGTPTRRAAFLGRNYPNLGHKK